MQLFQSEQEINISKVGGGLSFEMIIKNWYRTPDIYQSVPKTDWTVFDIGSTLVMLILFCHSVIIMNVARESILIFIDEHKQ